MFEEATISIMGLPELDAALRENGKQLREKRTAVATAFQQAGTELDLMKVTAFTGATKAERMTELDKIQAEVDDLAKVETQLNARRTDLETEQAKLLQARDANARALAGMNTPTAPVTRSTPGFTQPSQIHTTVIPPNQIRGGILRAFKGENAEVRAFRFGNFMLALAGSETGKRFCEENGIPLQQRAMSEDNNAKGGVVVPPEFLSDLIRNIEEYGVARKHARIYSMKSNTLSVPRRIGGITAHAVGEGKAITESDNDRYDMINLVAKKIAAKTKITSELDEDAVINVGDDSADEIAQAFAEWEDQATFNANGEKAYHGIVGIRYALKNLDTTIANIAGLKVASGTGYATSYNGITITDIQQTLALGPQWMRKNGKIYTSPFFYEGVMVPLLHTLGGATGAEAIKGLADGRYLGKEVVFVQVMPEVSETNQVCMLFGDLRKGVAFGVRREMTIRLFESGDDVDNDTMTMRGTERLDINVHDVGNASATASLRRRGAIVGLITGAS